MANPCCNQPPLPRRQRVGNVVTATLCKKHRCLCLLWPLNVVVLLHLNTVEARVLISAPARYKTAQTLINNTNPFFSLQPCISCLVHGIHITGDVNAPHVPHQCMQVCKANTNVSSQISFKL